ncbi:MAG: aldo/keto reductase [Candidatus Helarchaeota archaeon]
MKYLELGKDKTKVSVIGLGTWQFGTKGWGYGKEFGKDDAIRLINLAIDKGVNLLDTAELYGDGKSEDIIGYAIKERKDEVFIASKVFLTHLSYSKVLKACEKSLKRLNVKTIDLYQIHWPNPLFKLKSTIKALDKLVDDGKIRYIGVSNFNEKRLEKARSLSKHEIVTDQVRYNLLCLRSEKSLIPYCKDNDIKIIAYSPLAQGLLTGKYDIKNRLKKKGARRTNAWFAPPNLKKATPMINKLKEIAKKYDKTPAQVALNWLLSNNIVFVIPGAKNTKQLEQNIGSLDFNLSQTEITELREIGKNMNRSIIKAIPWMIGLQK